jgi:hypothetical protein
MIKISHPMRKKISLVFGVFFVGIFLASVTVLIINVRIPILADGTQADIIQNTAIAMVGAYFSLSMAFHKHSKRPYAYSRE